MIYPCPDEGLTNLPKADFVILRDSHGGWGFGNLSYTDPAVVNDNNPARRRPQLDMYDPSNGYDPSTLSANYGDRFLRNFLDGQSSRYNDHISLALDRLAKIEADQGDYIDDEPFVIPRADGAAGIWPPDLRLQERTRKAFKLLKDGVPPSVERIHSVRVPDGRTRRTNPTPPRCTPASAGFSANMRFAAATGPLVKTTSPASIGHHLTPAHVQCRRHQRAAFDFTA
jgi:hypothetical protein